MTTADELVRDYLTRLSHLASRLRPEDHDELVTQMTHHIAAARLAEGSDETATRNVLERLGTPEEIVGADDWRPGFDGLAGGASLATITPQPRLRWQEIGALVLLPFGAFVFLVGWLFGVVLLWLSDRWRTWEKVLGTLVLPFGYLTVGYLGVAPAEMCERGPDGVETCSGYAPPLWLGATVFVLLALAPLVVVVFLGRRAAPGRATPARTTVGTPERV